MSDQTSDQTTTSSGESLTPNERLELESLREVWRTLKPFIAAFSLSVVMTKVDEDASTKAMLRSLESYGPLSDAILAYVKGFPTQAQAEVRKVAA